MICPFLGIPGDSKTSLAFPSTWNCCHHCSPVLPVALDHQKKSCLTGEYEACPVFQQEANTALPRDLRYVKSRLANRNAFWKIAFAIPAFLMMVLVFGGNFFVQGMPLPIGSFSETSSPTGSLLSLPATLMESTPTTFLEMTPVPASPSTLTPSPLPNPDSTLSRSRVTPIITRKPHGMGEWIGVNYIFVIYRVKQGWSIERLAAHYDTTAAALMAVNYRLITPLYPGQLIVIPINQVDVSGLPQFEAYQVTEDISLEELAERLSVDPFQLQYFNGFGMDEQITAREWIIVPRERTK